MRQTPSSDFFHASVTKVGNLLWILIAVLLLASCSLRQTTAHSANNETQNEQHALQLSQLTGNTPTSEAYLDFYHIAPGGMRERIQYYYGYAGFKEPRVSCHVFLPRQAKGTLFVLHGYFDHVGSLNYFINAALEAGYGVFAYDLPGHGDSDGIRGDIGGVAENAALLETLLKQYRVFLPKPLHLVGFSTGGSVALEYARNIQHSPFDKVILVSPLLHHVGWNWGRLGYEISQPFIDEVPRMDRGNSSNIEYLEFAKRDPKRNVQVSMEFLEDVYDWNNSLSASNHPDVKMLVIQGDADEVVDWKYNLPLIRKNFKNSQVYMVKQGKHQLFNENETIRAEVFHQIFDVYLQTNRTPSPD